MQRVNGCAGPGRAAFICPAAKRDTLRLSSKSYTCSIEVADGPFGELFGGDAWLDHEIGRGGHAVLPWFAAEQSSDHEQAKATTPTVKTRSPGTLAQTSACMTGPWITSALRA